MMRIVLPEGDDPRIREAAEFLRVQGLADPILLTGVDDLREACQIVRDHEADAVIAGIDLPTRDIVQVVHDTIGAKDQVYSSCFLLERDGRDGRPERLILADAGVNKNPTADELYHILEQTYITAETLLNQQPRVALLSYSTHGSGFDNEAPDADILKLREVLERSRREHPLWIIDGELQLDAAISDEISFKKAPRSTLAGNANVFIVPNLAAGNVLFMALKHFAGFRAYGPLLQGFNAPCSDLSRGATTADIIGTAVCITKLFNK
ncbi:phosphate acyltransferase [Candidatus Saccharibacteria bacterium]|nr:phosphate acyltransferase [Candidatus Saccharibacteria bacterium]